MLDHVLTHKEINERLMFDDASKYFSSHGCPHFLEGSYEVGKIMMVSCSSVRRDGASFPKGFYVGRNHSIKIVIS